MCSLRRVSLGMAFLGLLVWPRTLPAQVPLRSVYPGGDTASWSTFYLPVLQSDPDPMRRRQAAQMLGLHGDSQAIPVLAKAAAFDPDRDVRIASGDAIALIRHRTHQDWVKPRPPGLGGGNYHERLVRGWYQLYLHRAPDPGGLAQWVGELRRGTDPEAVQATLLGSDEYYKTHGGTSQLWVSNMFKDLLGRPASLMELRLWTSQLRSGVSREQVALEFLRASKDELIQQQGAKP